VAAENVTLNCDKVTVVLGPEKDGMSLNNKEDPDECKSVENLADIHQNAVDMTLGDSIAPNETAKVEAESRTTRNKHHECELCGKICSSRAALVHHYSSQHDAGATSSDKIQLRLAQRILNRKHPSCWLCGVVCSSLVLLKKHFARKHSVEDQSILGDELLLHSFAFPVYGFRSKEDCSGSSVLSPDTDWSCCAGVSDAEMPNTNGNVSNKGEELENHEEVAGDACDPGFGDCTASGDKPAVTEETVADAGRLPRSSTRHSRCGCCGKICSSLAMLRQHYSVWHSAAPSADKMRLRLARRSLSRKHPSCWVCGVLCSSLALLRKHFSVKHSTEDQSVLGDENRLRSMAFPVNVLRSDKSRRRGPVLCHACGMMCRTLRQLSEHHSLHRDGVIVKRETAEGGLYVCETCGKVCSRPSALSSHRRLHLRPKAAAPCCGICGQRFTMRKNLLRHQRRHTGDRPHVCEHCGFSYFHRASLRDHILRQHRDEVAAADSEQLAFRCRRCGARFPQKCELRRHVVERHRPETPKERSLCAHCGKSFSRASTLALHVRLHTGLLPHKCGNCEAAFPTRTALRQHSLRHANPLDYPHVCATCGRRFALPSGLSNHERVHSGLKPFNCDHCGRQFGRRYRLSRHILQNHAETPSLDLHCSNDNDSDNRS